MDEISSGGDGATIVGQGNAGGDLDAMMQSSRIWMMGCQDLSKTMAGMAKAQFESTMSAYRALGGARSLSEAMEIHKSHAHQCLEMAIADGNSITSATMKLRETAMAPITEHFTAKVATTFAHGSNAN